MNRISKYTALNSLPKIDTDVILPHKLIKTKDFAREIDLQEYAVKNISIFCKDILNDSLISFEQNYPIDCEKQVRLSPRGRRIDLLVKGQKKLYIIEFKNPKYAAENRYGIGQLLDYGREFSQSNKELVLITTLFDIHTARTIQYYKLPIRYIYFDKQRTLEFKEENTIS